MRDKADESYWIMGESIMWDADPYRVLKIPIVEPLIQLSPAACDPLNLWAEYAVWGFRYCDCEPEDFGYDLTVARL